MGLAQLAVSCQPIDTYYYCRLSKLVTNPIQSKEGINGRVNGIFYRSNIFLLFMQIFTWFKKSQVRKTT